MDAEMSDVHSGTARGDFVTLTGMLVEKHDPSPYHNNHRDEGYRDCIELYRNTLDLQSSITDGTLPALVGKLPYGWNDRDEFPSSGVEILKQMEACYKDFGQRGFIYSDNPYKALPDSIRMGLAIINHWRAWTGSTQPALVLTSDLSNQQQWARESRKYFDKDRFRPCILVDGNAAQMNLKDLLDWHNYFWQDWTHHQGPNLIIASSAQVLLQLSSKKKEKVSVVNQIVASMPHSGQFIDHNTFPLISSKHSMIILDQASHLLCSELLKVQGDFKLCLTPETFHDDHSKILPLLQFLRIPPLGDYGFFYQHFIAKARNDIRHLVRDDHGLQETIDVQRRECLQILLASILFGDRKWQDCPSFLTSPVVDRIVRVQDVLHPSRTDHGDCWWIDRGHLDWTVNQNEAVFQAMSSDLRAIAASNIRTNVVSSQAQDQEEWTTRAEAFRSTLFEDQKQEWVTKSAKGAFHMACAYANYYPSGEQTVSVANRERFKARLAAVPGRWRSSKSLWAYQQTIIALARPGKVLITAEDIATLDIMARCLLENGHENYIEHYEHDSDQQETAVFKTFEENPSIRILLMPRAQICEKMHKMRIVQTVIQLDLRFGPTRNTGYELLRHYDRMHDVYGAECKLLLSHDVVAERELQPDRWKIGRLSRTTQLRMALSTQHKPEDLKLVVTMLKNLARTAEMAFRPLHYHEIRARG